MKHCLIICKYGELETFITRDIYAFNNTLLNILNSNLIHGQVVEFEMHDEKVDIYTSDLATCKALKHNEKSLRKALQYNVLPMNFHHEERGPKNFINKLKGMFLSQTVNVLNTIKDKNNTITKIKS